MELESSTYFDETYLDDETVDGDETDDDEVVGHWGVSGRRTRPCVRCNDAEARFLLGHLDGDIEELCTHCAGVEVGEVVTHPVTALRAHLLHMGLVEQVRRAPILGNELRAEAADIRIRALGKLHDQLGSWSAVARHSGLSEARVANLATGRDRQRRRVARRERLFAPPAPPRSTHDTSDTDT